MGRFDTSRAGELRILAEKLRRQAAEMNLPDYIAQMRRAADLIDAEAEKIDHDEMPALGSHLDIHI
jgi:hypothetical protein